jgi:hypothetical protein
MPVMPMPTRIRALVTAVVSRTCTSTAESLSGTYSESTMSALAKVLPPIRYRGTNRASTGAEAVSSAPP